MNNQYIIDELCKEAAYHANAYQEKMAMLKVAGRPVDPGILAKMQNYFSGLGSDVSGAASGLWDILKTEGMGAYNAAKSLGSSAMRRGGKAFDIAKDFVTAHPWETAGAVATPLAALGTAYGMGAFDGPEEGMSPEDMYKQSSYNPYFTKTAGKPVDPGILAKMQNYFSGLGSDISGAASGLYNQAKGLGKDALSNAKALKFLAESGLENAWDITKGFATKHPWETAGAVATPLAALGTAYGMGAFDGDEEGMSPEDMYKQSSYNPYFTKTAKKVVDPGILAKMQNYFSGLGSDISTAASGLYGNAKKFGKGAWNAAKDSYNIAQNFVTARPWETAGAVATPLAALGTAYGLGAFDKQSSYDPSINEKTASYDEIIDMVRQNPGLRQTLLNM